MINANILDFLHILQNKQCVHTHTQLTHVEDNYQIVKYRQRKKYKKTYWKKHLFNETLNLHLFCFVWTVDTLMSVHRKSTSFFFGFLFSCNYGMRNGRHLQSYLYRLSACIHQVKSMFSWLIPGSTTPLISLQLVNHHRCYGWETHHRKGNSAWGCGFRLGNYLQNSQSAKSHL